MLKFQVVSAAALLILWVCLPINKLLAQPDSITPYAMRLQELQRAPRDTNTLNQLLVLSEEYAYHDIGFSYDVALQVQALAKKLKRPDVLAKAQTLLAKNAANLNKLDTAISYATLLEKYATRQRDSVLLADMLYLRGTISMWNGNNKAATEAYRKALAIHEAAGNRSGQAKLYAMLANALIVAGRDVEAERPVKESLRIARELKDTLTELLALHMYVSTLDRQGKTEEALLFATEALVSAKAFGNLTSLYKAQSTYGRVLVNSGKYQAGIDELNRASDISEVLYGVRYIDGAILGDLSNGYAKMGNYKKSIETVRRQLQIQLADGSTYEMHTIYNNLAGSFAQLNKYDSAFHYSLLAAAIKDSMYTKTNAQDMSELETRYQTSERELELREQAEVLEIQQRNFRLTLGLLVVALLAAGIVGFLALQLRKRNKEREVLVHEVHHRVKNNLQVLSSLLYLQRRHVNDPAAVAAIQESQHRVEAMGLIHQRLYTRDRLTTVQMNEYLGELAETLRDAFGREGVDINLDVPAVEFPVQLAIDLGLIANELISNSFKYAFSKTSTSGTVWIRLESIDNMRYRLEIADDGAGDSAIIDEEASTGFGSQLVQLLSQKLGASPEVEKSERGYGTTIEFMV